MNTAKKIITILINKLVEVGKFNTKREDISGIKTPLTVNILEICIVLNCHIQIFHNLIVCSHPHLMIIFKLNDF